MRTIPKAAIDLIKECEGLYLEAYRCPAGKWTIGYGSRVDVHQGLVITEAQADERLAADLADSRAWVERLVTVPLTDGRFGALVSLIFNIGATAFARSTLLQRLNASDYAGARSEFARWVYGGGRELPGLVRRRLAEQKLWDT